MIASRPVRVLSLAIVALVVLVGVRGIVSGMVFSDGGLLAGDDRTQQSADGDSAPRKARGVLRPPIDSIPRGALAVGQRRGPRERPHPGRRRHLRTLAALRRG